MSTTWNNLRLGQLVGIDGSIVPVVEVAKKEFKINSKIKLHYGKPNLARFRSKLEGYESMWTPKWIDRLQTYYLNLEALSTFDYYRINYGLFDVCVPNPEAVLEPCRCLICLPLRSPDKIGSVGRSFGAECIRYDHGAFDDIEILEHNYMSSVIIVRHHRHPHRFVAWSYEHVPFTFANAKHIARIISKRVSRNFHIAFHMSSIIDHAHVHLIPIDNDMYVDNLNSMDLWLRQIANNGVAKGLIDVLFVMSRATDYENYLLPQFVTNLIHHIITEDPLPIPGNAVAIAKFLEDMWERDPLPLVDRTTAVRWLNRQGHIMRLMTDIFPAAIEGIDIYDLDLEDIDVVD
jgi:hypothetical protein